MANWKNSCCFKCPIHTPSCHGTCPDYAKEFAKNEERRQEERKERDRKNAFYSPAFDRRQREALNNKK